MDLVTPDVITLTAGKMIECKPFRNKILETVPADFQREDHSAQVREAGFDIESTAEYLCDFYRKALEHGRSKTGFSDDSHADL